MKKLLQNTFKLKNKLKVIVKQEKRNKELIIARICKHNPKIFYSYNINERRILREKKWPFKTLYRIVITTDNDMANTMNYYFSSVFTIEQLNNVPQLGQCEGNILYTLNFSTIEVQEKLQHLNIIIQVHRIRYVSPSDTSCIRGQTC